MSTIQHSDSPGSPRPHIQGGVDQLGGIKEGVQEAYSILTREMGDVIRAVKETTDTMRSTRCFNTKDETFQEWGSRLDGLCTRIQNILYSHKLQTVDLVSPTSSPHQKVAGAPAEGSSSRTRDFQTTVKAASVANQDGDEGTPPRTRMRDVGVNTDPSVQGALDPLVEMFSGEEFREGGNPLTCTPPLAPVAPTAQDGSFSRKKNPHDSPHSPFGASNTLDSSLGMSLSSSANRVRGQSISTMGKEQRKKFTEEQDDKKIRYKLGKVMGSGAHGTVHSALIEATGESVAAKKIVFDEEASVGEVDEKLHSLQVEVNLLKALEHPNIVRYLFADKVEGPPRGVAIFMELVSGGSISQIVTEFGALPERTAAIFTAQLLFGLDYLHEKGVAHRDIKPANCLVSALGDVKLGDFGTATLFEPKDGESASGLESVPKGHSGVGPCGTPFYMAPEVLRSDPDRCHWQSDIWSLGCSVMEMLTGHHPFHHISENAAKVLKFVGYCKPGDAVSMPTGHFLSPEALDFLRHCCASAPEQRPPAAVLLHHPWFAAFDIVELPNAGLAQPLATVEGEDGQVVKVIDQFFEPVLVEEQEQCQTFLPVLLPAQPPSEHFRDDDSSLMSDISNHTESQTTTTGPGESTPHASHQKMDFITPVARPSIPLSQRRPSLSSNTASSTATPAGISLFDSIHQAPLVSLCQNTPLAACPSLGASSESTVSMGMAMSLMGSVTSFTMGGVSTTSVSIKRKMKLRKAAREEVILAMSPSRREELHSQAGGFGSRRASISPSHTVIRPANRSSNQNAMPQFALERERSNEEESTVVLNLPTV